MHASSPLSRARASNREQLFEEAAVAAGAVDEVDLQDPVPRGAVGERFAQGGGVVVTDDLPARRIPVVWEAIDDVQMVVNYRYWSRVQADSR